MKTCFEAQFQELPEADKKKKLKDLDKKIKAWWDQRRKPHKDGKREELSQIKSFFSDLAGKRGLAWDDGWFERSVKELKENERDLWEAVEKFEEPYAIARIFKERYKKSTLLPRVIEKYCHQCFYIYRLHTGTGTLVQDILRFRGVDEEKIFCTIYQYTNHNPDYLKWENIKVFKGNVFFNNASLDITFVSDKYDQEQGPQYGNIVCPRFFENKERLGILMALTDETHHPAAAAILIRRAKDIPHPLNLKKIHDYVKELEPGSIRDYQEIYNKIADKRICIEQPEKGTGFIKIPTTKR